MRRPLMKKLLEKLAAMMTTAALAEEGVSEKARQLVEEGGRDDPAHPAGGGR